MSGGEDYPTEIMNSKQEGTVEMQIAVPLFLTCDSDDPTRLFGNSSADRRLRTLHAVALLLVVLMSHSIIEAETVARKPQLRPFTVADDIGLASFNDPLLGQSPITLSPDGRYVAVRIERGLLKQNLLEDELRIYDMAVLRKFVNGPHEALAPQPAWKIRASTYSEGVLISGVRWLRDSKGLAYLVKDGHGRCQLMLSDLTHSPELLSIKGQNVTAFDIRNAHQYVYTVRSDNVLKRVANERTMPAVDVTGQPATSVLFPNYEAAWDDRSDLWAALGSSPHGVTQLGGRGPIVIYDEGHLSMALSPDGNILATALPVADVPPEWATRYAPPYKGDSLRIHAGHQTSDVNMGSTLVSEYVTIDLHSGKTTSVAMAPTGRAAHWVAGGIASLAWSKDGHYLALPSTFTTRGSTSREPDAPCLAISDLSKSTVQCLEPIGSPYSEDGKPSPKYFFVDQLDFTDSSLLLHYRHYDQSKGIRIFSLMGGEWKESSDRETSIPLGGLTLSIDEGLNVPPVLKATDVQTRSSRSIWDPNPQLRAVKLGDAVVYHWTDEEGHEWTGGLYKPPDYTPGRRYPLIIQTHGFEPKLFLPSGTMSTAFAARALAANGMVVLQVRGCPIRVSVTDQEAPCNVHGYEAAVRQLKSEGLIDPNRIGIIGFSRTCYYVMDALTASDIHFKAASLTDGVNYGYWQYLFGVDLHQNQLAHEYEAIYETKPFGEGLQQWIKHSPEFKMDRVNAPLLIVGEGEWSLLSMWEPYAALRYLHKPTDLVLLHTNEHILTNPAVRLASQGGSVDWFRFWLQGYEDPAPAKAEQYRRWEGLCDIQITEHSNEPSYCVKSKQ